MQVEGEAASSRVKSMERAIAASCNHTPPTANHRHWYLITGVRGPPTYDVISLAWSVEVRIPYRTSLSRFSFLILHPGYLTPFEVYPNHESMSVLIKDGPFRVDIVD